MRSSCAFYLVPYEAWDFSILACINSFCLWPCITCNVLSSSPFRWILCWPQVISYICAKCYSAKYVVRGLCRCMKTSLDKTNSTSQYSGLKTCLGLPRLSDLYYQLRGSPGLCVGPLPVPQTTNSQGGGVVDGDNHRVYLICFSSFTDHWSFIDWCPTVSLKK